jgi:glutaredoxin 3
MLDFLNPILKRYPDRVKANVEIYTWQTCPYCIRAKILLWWKGVRFTEYKIDGNEADRNRMAQRANGRRTVPQVFINDRLVGGCDDLYQLDSQGQLDPLLAQSSGT